jgi:hypothetical protein
MSKRRIATLVTYELVLGTPAMFSLAAAQAPDSVPPYSISGFVESFYSVNFAKPASRVNQFRNFDIAESQFILSAAEVDIQRTADPVGFRIDASVGSASDLIHSGISTGDKLFQQAYLTFVAPVGSGLTIDAGKFVTHMGNEVIKSKDNYNFSRSFSFAWSIPYYHYGVRLGYPVAENFGLTLSVTNGWNGGSPNPGKTFGLSASLPPVGPLSVVANWIGGPAEPDTLSKTWRNVGEVIVSVSASEKLTFVADATLGKEPMGGVDNSWKGFVVYARYALCETSALALRAEVYDDLQGFSTLVPQTLKEVSLTYETKPLSNLLLRGELRHDLSSADVFDTDTGISNHQTTIAVAAVVIF